MRPGKFQDPSTIMKTMAWGASGGVSGARLFWECKNALDLIFVLCLLAPISRFGEPFLTASDFEGGPKVDNFETILNKIKKDTRNAFEKHDCLINS